MWILGLLTCIPWVAGAFAVHLYRWAEHRGATRDVERLNGTAGGWLYGELIRRDLDEQLELIATDASSKLHRDCFIPRTRTIVLTIETYAASTVTAWATAAHELGHAMVALHSPLRSGALLFARSRYLAWFGIAISLIVGNMLVARQGATVIALALLVIATGLGLGQLIDEAWASLLASRVLAPHLSPAQLRVARTDLALAFITYAGPAITRMLVLASWPLIIRLGEHPRVPPLGHLTTFGTGVAVLCTVLLAVHALVPVAMLIGSRVGMIAGLISMTEIFAVAGLLYLGWDRSASPLYAWCVLLAFARISLLVQLAIQLPFWIPIGTALHKLKIGKREPYVAPRRQDFSAELKLTSAGGLRIDEIASSDLFERRRRVWRRRLKIAMYAPLVIAFWLAG